MAEGSKLTSVFKKVDKNWLPFSSRMRAEGHQTKFARARLKKNKREINAVCATELLRKDIVSGKSLHGLTKNLYNTLKREAFRVTKQKREKKRSNLWNLLSQKCWELGEYLQELCSFPCFFVFSLLCASAYRHMDSGLNEPLDWDRTDVLKFRNCVSQEDLSGVCIYVEP